MHGLVTLLPELYYEKVTALWDGLEAAFGLNGIRITPYPHFSWNIAESYTRPEMDAALALVAGAMPPLSVTTDGIGLFSAPRPVLFIKVVRNPELDALHARLWAAMGPLTDGLSDYYSPEQWQPHISLAYGDLTTAQVPEVRDWLESQDSFDWSFEVDNVSFIYEPDGQIGDLQLRVPLGR
jgi:2'-5' RNA ligase